MRLPRRGAPNLGKAMNAKQISPQPLHSPLLVGAAAALAWQRADPNQSLAANWPQMATVWPWRIAPSDAPLAARVTWTCSVMIQRQRGLPRSERRRREVQHATDRSAAILMALMRAIESGRIAVLPHARYTIVQATGAACSRIGKRCVQTTDCHVLAMQFCRGKINVE